MTWMIHLKYNVNDKDKLYPIVELIDEYKKTIGEDFDKTTLEEVKRMLKEEMAPEKILETYGITKESMELIKPQGNISAYHAYNGIKDDILGKHRVCAMYNHILRYF